MGLSTLILLAVFVTVLIAALYCIVKAGDLPVIIRVIANLPFVGVALFSIFGFLASGEPGVSPLWKVGYGALFLCCTIAVIRLTTARRCVEE